jgi:hypothetical protein
MNSDEEIIDEIGFRGAIDALHSLGAITEIQNAAKETVNADISICYSKLDGYEHELYFVINPPGDIPESARTTLTKRIARLLSYDEISVLLPKVRLETQYALLTPINSENIEKVHHFLAEYSRYIEEKNANKKVSSVFESFVDLLRDSDAGEKENLLRRLVRECDDMDICLELEVKRPRMKN